ncbi:hypothetical protein GGF44_006340, partial [Coemansia sp. RSA 1694]
RRQTSAKILRNSQTTPPKRTRSSGAEAGLQRSSKRQKPEEAATRSASVSQDTDTRQIQAMTLSRGSSAHHAIAGSSSSNSNGAHIQGSGASPGTNGNVVGMALQSATSATVTANCNSSEAPTDSDGQLLRYPGMRKEAPRHCLRQSQFGEEQVVRLMLQELRDRGFTDSYRLLQSESGYTLEDEPVARFRDSILSGKWSEVESALSSIGIDSHEHVTVSAETVFTLACFTHGLPPDFVRGAIAQHKS